ncbi:MAG TPA: amidohydrolase family protein [Gemmatimonadaceae bacterium]|nr:amidohydrolase family protein [Gemmatimonadaceae bacterium]
MLLLIEGAELHAPEPRGRQAILVANDRIEKIGVVDRRALDALDVEHEVIDARGCIVTPGFVDPHQHFLGGSGEGSLALQTPMLLPREILRAGITTAVGTLGVDTTMKTIQGLLGRVKALREEGVDAFMWSGGYNVPPTTLLGSVRQDMMYVEEVIGAGEVAVADERGLNQSGQELAKLVRDTHVGGLLTGKAGLTHFHVGEEPVRLQPLRELIDDFQVKVEWLYPTHVQRSEALLREAMELAVAGAYVDFDTVNEDLARWFRWWMDHDGPIDRLTISSDADSGTPDSHYRQLCALVVKERYPLEVVLPLATSNVATALKLSRKGRVRVGCDADLVVMDAGTLEIRDVIARGRRVVREGRPSFTEKFLGKSKRHLTLHGAEAPPGLERLEPVDQ